MTGAQHRRSLSAMPEDRDELFVPLCNTRLVSTLAELPTAADRVHSQTHGSLRPLPYLLKLTSSAALLVLSGFGRRFAQFIRLNKADGGVNPAPEIYVDYSPRGVRGHTQHHHPGLRAVPKNAITAEEELLPPVGPCTRTTAGSARSVGTWSGGPEARDPLALRDGRTFGEDDCPPVNSTAPCLCLPGREDGGA
ncbi:hypothetical protein DL769_000337 [Monosporascus sp. CRB-8-3]|nr:hypothetical protein DL769_000337 [Monosporascus sp. CRB-8-3]